MLKKSYVAQSAGQFSCPLAVGEHKTVLKGFGLKVKKGNTDAAINAKVLALKATLSAQNIPEIIENENHAEAAIKAANALGLEAWQAFWGFSFLQANNVTFKQGNIKGVTKIDKSYDLIATEEEWGEPDAKGNRKKAIRLALKETATPAKVETTNATVTEPIEQE